MLPTRILGVNCLTSHTPPIQVSHIKVNCYSKVRWNNNRSLSFTSVALNLFCFHKSRKSEWDGSEHMQMGRDELRAIGESGKERGDATQGQQGTRPPGHELNEGYGRDPKGRHVHPLETAKSTRHDRA